MSSLVLALAVALFVAGVAVGIRNWRWSLLGLVVFLPVSGIAIDWAYGDRLERAVTVLAKDYLFVLPAYLGFALEAVRRRRSPLFSGAPVVALALLAAVVIAQSLNPQVPNVLVALIGIKVWLFYVPLLFLGYHLVRTPDELRRLLGLVTLAALPPAVIGIVEGMLVYTGHEHAVYALYGDAAGAVTQNYEAFVVAGTAAFKRVPSTFSSAYQYYLFLSVSLACGLAWCRGTSGTHRRAVGGVAAVVVLLAALFLSGIRLAFVMAPLLVALALLFDRTPPLRVAVILVPAVCLVVAVGGLIGATPNALTSHFVHNARVEFRGVIVRPGDAALSTTVFGVGTGVDSVAARYAFETDAAWLDEVVRLLGGWRESWYIKTWLELGVFGALAVVMLFGLLLYRGATAVRDAAAGFPTTAAAALLALVVWSMLYSVKAQYLDLDPLNVYFWLLAGVLMKIPHLAPTRRDRFAGGESPSRRVAGVNRGRGHRAAGAVRAALSASRVR